MLTIKNMMGFLLVMFAVISMAPVCVACLYVLRFGVLMVVPLLFVVVNFITKQQMMSL